MATKSAQLMKNWMCLNTAIKLIFATLVSIPAPAMAVAYHPSSAAAQSHRVYRLQPTTLTPCVMFQL